MLQQLGRALTRVEDFFGCPAGYVDPIVLRIATRYDFPEWLRGRTKIKELPNRKFGASRHFFSVGAYSLDKQADLLVWLIENVRGAWDYSEGGCVWLDNDVDAVQFRLTYSEVET